MTRKEKTIDNTAAMFNIRLFTLPMPQPRSIRTRQ